MPNNERMNLGKMRREIDDGPCEARGLLLSEQMTRFLVLPRHWDLLFDFCVLFWSLLIFLFFMLVFDLLPLLCELSFFSLFFARAPVFLVLCSCSRRSFSFLSCSSFF